VDGRGLRSPHDVKRDGLMCVAPKAAHFEIVVASVEGIAERRRRLRRAAIAEHPFVPRFAGNAVGFLAGSGGTISRSPDGRAEDGFRVIWCPWCMIAPNLLDEKPLDLAALNETDPS
jgi:hypothetical protein